MSDMINDIPTIDIVLVSHPVTAQPRKLVGKFKMAPPTFTTMWVGSKREYRKMVRAVSAQLAALPEDDRRAFYAKYAPKKREVFTKRRIRSKRRKDRKGKKSFWR